MKVTPVSSSAHSIWSPWDFAETPSDADNLDAECIGAAVRSTVEALATGRGRVLIGISGGLDSSIVAACLDATAADDALFFMTVSTTSPDGDERIYSRRLAHHLDRDLIETFYDLKDIDLDKSAAPQLPFPVSRSQSLSYDARVAEQAKLLGADTFFTGNGGDNVFAMSNSATALYDRFLSEGFGQGLFVTLRNICKLTGCSPWQALRGAYRVSRWPTRSYNWKTNSLFLDHDVIDGMARIKPRHDWLRAPQNALPGKAVHIAGLLQIQRHLHASEQGIGVPVVNPLMAQPVMEACLRMPSWRWCEDGVNRSMARRAFANDLPREIAYRTTKGRPDSFCAEIVDTRRPEIRDRLLDGHLARNSLVDIEAIERALDNRAPNMGVEKVRLLTLLEVEAWASNWSGQVPQGLPPRA